MPAAVAGRWENPTLYRSTLRSNCRLARLRAALRAVTAACLLTFALSCAGGSPAPEADAPRPSVANPDDLLIVDCLLPPQIKNLGQRITYAAARRAIRTSAVDCRIRGGEYVAHDRADYASALRVWLPLAKEGNAEAQSYVGEIYEKGLGLSPDYATAAGWYRRAAEQGYAAAQINLGQLYELGLGVPRDLQAAQRWYRQASGLGEAVGAGFVPSAAPATELATLRRQLAASEREAERLREEREGLREELALARQRRSEERERVEVERSALVTSQQTLDGRSEALARRARELAEERKRLASLEVASRSDREQVAQQLAALETQAETLRRQEEAVAQEKEALVRRARSIEARERELAKRERRQRELEREIEQLSSTLAEYQRAEAARQEVEAEPPPEAAVEVAGPTIQILQPEAPIQRGIQVTRSTIPLEGDVLLVGRVEAPGGLYVLTIDDREAPVEANGLFRTPLPAVRGEREITLVAIDRQGKKAQRTLVVAGPATQPPPVPAPAPVPDVEFGRFHALVIGNNDYRALPDLKTATRDAEAVASLLGERYGFEVRLLRNATRYDILSALNDLRGKLDARDNLLIYYAGHGELDRVNNRGHWLPVDAEPGSSANWISNVAITDVLNAMSSNHVLVVADSCYSGALARSSMARLEAGMTDRARSAWIKTMVEKRSRTALTSGGLEPVLDSGGGQHSIFARVFLEVLERNQTVLEGQALFQEVSARVTWAAQGARFDQVPQYAPIRYAGHEAGEFFFVPKP